VGVMDEYLAEHSALRPLLKKFTKECSAAANVQPVMVVFANDKVMGLATPVSLDEQTRHRILLKVATWAGVEIEEIEQ
jgi:hypothetical protein